MLVFSSVSAPSLDHLLDFALAIARAAGELALSHFQTSLQVETKADLTPVTIADRDAEKLLRMRIEEAFPDHGILGEELGVLREHAPYRWVLDPIDGTKAFIRGVPLWGVLVGLEENLDPVLGVAHFPALGETLWARRGGGCWWNGRQARVSSVSRVEDATLLVADVRSFEPAGVGPAFERLRSATRFERTWGDCYGHALVATGRAEIMLDPVMNEWDCCALLPVVEEAGGRFVDWTGARTVRGGSAISTNAALFEPVMRLISKV